MCAGVGKPWHWRVGNKMFVFQPTLPVVVCDLLQVITVHDNTITAVCCNQWAALAKPLSQTARRKVDNL